MLYKIMIDHEFNGTKFVPAARKSYNNCYKTIPILAPFYKTERQRLTYREPVYAVTNYTN